MKDQERIEVMARHFIIAAIWADAPEGTKPRATKQAIEAAKQICLAFCESVGPEALREVQRAKHDGYGSHPDCGNLHSEFAAMGHDLWLTSQGHGAGFWDREQLPEDLRNMLTEKARISVWPEFYRGWLYLHG